MGQEQPKPPPLSASSPNDPTDACRAPELIEALRQTQLLDKPAEEDFDRLTRFAAYSLRAPVALLTLRLNDRQVLLGQVGVEEPWASRREVPMEYSCFQHALCSEEPLMIENARDDARVQHNPAVSENGAIAYAGVPLMAEGCALGTLCVVDSRPRAWTENEIEILHEVSATATAEIKLRREVAEWERKVHVLAESEERFRALVGHAQEISTIVAADGTIRYESPAGERVLGYAPEERLGQNIFGFVHPDDSDAARASFAHIVEEALPGEAECRVRHKDGSYRVLSTTGVSLLGEAAVAGVILHSRDVTDLRRSEERLRQAQRMGAIGWLTSGLTHEFNNILNTIGGTTELLLMEAADDSTLAEDLREIDRATEQAASLTRKLLSFSRQAVVQPQILDLNVVARSTERMLRHTLGDDIELVLMLAPKLGRIAANPGQMQQLLLSLAMNARDAMPTGGELVVETQNAELDADVRGQYGYRVRPGPHVMLSVSDTGHGMSGEVREKIFEPFFTTRGQAAGLGLSTVYGMVKQLGGYIWVYSEPGQGTTVKLGFPRVDEGAAPLVGEAPPD